ncbi:hypothetical protein FIBSPDRAFT_927655 [Athelia psychrophila]|uniref:Uncharacterized protein n=1 Tax=Athelia psychrophila TaxID=1759441 RepID=A0A166RR60_9AGAM|nr:hypothetical protein FIBSPDRAFT_927655 [Fibularhizoctonia sp. CBS 109695]
MPNVSIVNETSGPLRFGLLIGPSPAYFNNYVARGDTFRANLPSIYYSFEACTIDTGNEYSTSDSLSRAGTMAGAVGMGTASMIVGTAWALGSLGGILTGNNAGVVTAGRLMDGAWAAGAVSNASRKGLVFQKGLLVGFSELSFAVRMENEHLDLVPLNSNRQLIAWMVIITVGQGQGGSTGRKDDRIGADRIGHLSAANLSGLLGYLFLWLSLELSLELSLYLTRTLDQARCVGVRDMQGAEASYIGMGNMQEAALRRSGHLAAEPPKGSSKGKQCAQVENRSDSGSGQL